MVDEMRLTLFSAGTIAKDSYHRKSPTRCEQNLKLRGTWNQTLLNEIMR